MKSKPNPTPPFVIRDCALVTMAVGVKAQSLREFRDGILKVPQDSIYHHFWGRLLQPQFDEPEFNNDFAAWARHGLHEKALAEKLAVVDPVRIKSIDDLRAELVEIIEERLDKSEYVPVSRADQQFHFLKSQIIIFDTGQRVSDPSEFGTAVKSMTPSSIFYHFVDARRRNPEGIDDFSFWLREKGTECDDLCRRLSTIDLYFSSLKRIRWLLADIFDRWGEGRS